MKLADVSIRRPVFATMVISALVIFVLIGYARIGVDLYPNVEFPIVTITAIYPGADPETIETKIITKMEDSVAGLAGIKELRSISRENVGQVVIRFELERNADQAAQEVRDKISAIMRDLPKEMEPPIISKVDLGAAPVVSLVLSAPKPIQELTKIADKKIKTRLQKILGVGSVDIVGGREREIHVLVRADQLEKNNLSIQDIFIALTAQNLEIPGGSIRQGPDELIVKTKGEVRNAMEIADLILPIPTAGAPIRIRDVAQVVDTTEEIRSYSS